MTKFTPNNGWPIAEETDVVKQYPTIIDEPFKMALDAASTVLNTDVQFKVGGTVFVLGTYSGTPDSAGNMMVPYMLPFPVTSTWAVAGLGSAMSAFVSASDNIADYTAAGFWVRCLYRDGTPFTTTVRVNYIAWGR